VSQRAVARGNANRYTVLRTNPKTVLGKTRNALLRQSEFWSLRAFLLVKTTLGALVTREGPQAAISSHGHLSHTDSSSSGNSWRWVSQPSSIGAALARCIEVLVVREDRNVATKNVQANSKRRSMLLRASRVKHTSYASAIRSFHLRSESCWSNFRSKASAWSIFVC
jgi:hypothetical protein